MKNNNGWSDPPDPHVIHLEGGDLIADRSVPADVVERVRREIAAARERESRTMNEQQRSQDSCTATTTIDHTPRYEVMPRSIALRLL